MFQFRTLLILFVISFAIIFIAYAEAEEDGFAEKSLSGSDSGSVTISNRHRRALLYGGYGGYAYLGYGGYGYGGYGGYGGYSSRRPSRYGYGGYYY